MNALAHSPSVHDFLNQPFHLTYTHPYAPPDNREEIAYQRIWKTYQQAREEHNEKTITLVIKCMARNLGIGERLFRLLDITDSIVLLIRNPYLSIDSLLRTQVATIEDMPEASQHDLNEYALQKGIEENSDSGKHWLALKQSILATKEYNRIDDLLIETMAFIELNKYEVDMAIEYQRRLDNHDEYTSLAEIQAIAWTGWDNMAVIAKQHLEKMHSFSIIDSTILRCMPERILRNLSEDIQISYSPEMAFDWQPRKVTDDEIIQSAWMKHCYETVASSSGIKPPQEIPITLDLFPEAFQKHLIKTAYPAYLALLHSSHTVRPRGHEEIQRLLDTAVTKEGTSLRKVDPVFSEALLTSKRKETMQRRCNNRRNKQKKNSSLERILDT